MSLNVKKRLDRRSRRYRAQRKGWDYDCVARVNPSVGPATATPRCRRRRVRCPFAALLLTYESTERGYTSINATLLICA
jgi:hypothetical protein